MRKLMQCKTCGNYIARSAQVCPYCGARQHQGALAVCAVIIVVVVFAIVGIIIDGDENPEKQPDNPQVYSSSSTVQPTPEVISISAEDLYTAYTENVVNADNLYTGKTLLVTGTIADIGQDLYASGS